MPHGGKAMDFTSGDAARLGFWFAVAAWVTWTILTFCRKLLELAVLATVMGIARLVLWMRPRSLSPVNPKRKDDEQGQRGGT
jgi:glycerol-3-phosphate acyltransferase PlsY